MLLFVIRMVLRSFFAFLVLMPLRPCLAHPDGNRFIKNALAAFQTYRTYQAEVVVSRRGTADNLSVTSVWKLDRHSQRVRIEMSGSQAGSPRANTIVDDGKTLVSYSKERNTYSAGPHITMGRAFPLLLVTQMLGDPNVKYLKSVIWAGRRVNVLKVEPDRQFARGMAATVLLYFDAATERFVRMTMTAVSAPDSQYPPKKVELELVVRREIINLPIPQSEFHFLPPRGAKLEEQDQEPRIIAPQRVGAGMGPRQSP